MFRRMRFLMALPIVLFTVLLGLGGTAGAAPKWVQWPIGGPGATSGTYPAGELCSFPISWQGVALNEHATFTTNRDRTITLAIQGVATLTFTNEVTGKTRFVNESGPATEVFYPSGQIKSMDARGPQLWMFPASVYPTGPPQGPSRFYETFGLAQATFNPDGTPAGTPTLYGTTVDLCVALGA
jgi:hypothetical protein